jgi:V8-like Glu-specific endopeptidase
VSVQAAQLTVSESVSASRQAAALAFWTRARIAAAPALALPVDRSAGGIDAAVLYEPEVIGPGSSSPPGAADPNAAQAARAIFWQDWMALEAEDEPALDEPALDEPADEMAGTRGVYTFYDVNRTSALWNIFPHKWDGKFTFTTPSGGASCSATVISGNNIVTAAHCVYDTPSRNQFYTNKVFTPAYRNGSAPFGTFATTTCSVLTAWVNLSGGFSINTWSRHDVAVCTLGRNALRQTINQAVGWAGRLWNAGNNQLVFNSGYPALNYADGSISNPAQYLRACTAETFLQTTQTLGGGCFWGRGISGGSLLVNYKPFVVSGNVNSVNSGLFIGQQNLYGARFNSANIVPLCNARGC